MGPGQAAVYSMHEQYSSHSTYLYSVHNDYNSDTVQLICNINPIEERKATLQRKGRWESNINDWFLFMYSLKWNCAASYF